MLLDALSGETVAEMRDIPINFREVSSSLYAAPDGRHVGVLRRESSVLEVWDLVGQRRVLEAPGRYIRFSDDAQRVAIGEDGYPGRRRKPLRLGADV